MIDRANYTDSSSSDEEMRHPKRSRSLAFTTNTTKQIMALSTVVHDLAKVVGASHSSASSASSNAPPSQHFRGHLVPDFNPEQPDQNVEAWCLKVDELKEIFGWTDETTVYHALSKLRGLAEVWYKGLPTIRFSWDEWKVKLQNAFPSRVDYFETLRRMLAREKCPSESYLRYFYEKSALLAACKIEGTDGVSCLIGGITDRVVQAAARAGDHATPESLLSYLKTCQEDRWGQGVG
ncbi:hypothetical protein ILUMI_14225, partial [Ignelater luminosus]